MATTSCTLLVFALFTVTELSRNLVHASGPCALLEPQADALCIPLASINRAFNDARQYLGLKAPLSFPPHKISHHLHEVDSLGMVLTQTTKYIAKEFQISQVQVEQLLPQLDLELTDIWGWCPHQFRSTKGCKISKYRETSGRCNNLNEPEWGAAHTPFLYLIPPDRPDGIDYPKDPESNYLPPARVVSSKMHNDIFTHDHATTIMLIAWGQIIDHDITLTAETKDSHTGKDPDCCKYVHGHDVKLHHNCFPIQIPHDDEFYAGHHKQCMNFARSISGVRTNCRLGSRTALNSIASFLDANFLYGSEEHLSNKLRTGKFGMLDSLPAFHKIGLKDLLPVKIEHPDEGCIRPNANVHCFLAGDHRVNEQLVLTVLHTIFMREHNRIAMKLAKINKHWDDERLYQETRRIIIAITQHITYEEFLPMVLGKRLLDEYQISVTKEGFWNGYDSKVNPSAMEEFITSAFRFGHSLLPNKIERWSVAHRFIESTELNRLIRQPFDIYKPGYVDTYILGMVNQLAQAMDEGVTEQVTTLLFRKPHKHFGMDLASINIQRGRDHAIPGYSEYRKLCGLSPVHHWEDLTGIMRNDTISKYRAIYRSPIDIDLWSGGVSEIPSYGSLIGPTFGCIIAKQFQVLRYGDRHWYEIPNLPSSFNEEQLSEIKKVKLSRVLCDNGDYIKNIQVYAMVLPEPQRNPRVPCQGLVLPRIDLSKWHESPANLNYHNQGKAVYHSHQENYATLHAPKFDPNFLKGYQNTPIYNLSHETTNYAEQPPNYHPAQDDHHNNAVDPEPKNAYMVPLDDNFHDQPRLPHRELQQDAPITFDDNYYHSKGEGIGGRNNYQNFYEINTQNVPHPLIHNDRPAIEILESLEAPPIDYQDVPVVYTKGEGYYDQPPLSHKYNDHPSPLPQRQAKQQYFSRNIPPRRRHVKPPFPDSPFPFFGGIFSPNPGYLVRQKFSIPRIPFKG